MKHANAQIFSLTLADVLVQFRNAVDGNNQNGANLCYVTALGLITGATLSGGLDQAKGKELLATLDETREAFEVFFGEAPGSPEIQIN